MNAIRTSPGPAAEYAFRLGVAAGSLLGLTALAIMYWQGVISLMLTGYLLVALFPVYVLVIATVLSVWLGFDKDMTSLRPVSRSEAWDDWR